MPMACWSQRGLGSGEGTRGRRGRWNGLESHRGCVQTGGRMDCSSTLGSLNVRGLGDDEKPAKGAEEQPV